MLRAVHDELGAPDAAAGAARAVELLRSRFDGVRWGNLFELLGGNAGIVRELLRFVRVSRGADPAYAFGRPDQPAVG